MLKKISVMIFISLFLLSSITVFAALSEQKATSVSAVRDAGKLNLFDERDDYGFGSGTGKTYYTPMTANTMAPTRQVCNGAITIRDYQHNSTIGRQLVYPGYYDANCDYTYMIYTKSFIQGATMVSYVSMGVFDWKSTHNWDFSCLCDASVSVSMARYSNLSYVPGTCLPVVAYHYGADASSPTWTYAGFTNDPCDDALYSKDSLPGPPNTGNVQTGYCGDVDALETPYIWPKVDVQYLDLEDPNVDSIITHVASNEAGCGDEPDDAIEISSLVYYRKITGADDVYGGTWEGPIFIDSTYSINQHVVAEKFGPNVYYVYLKPMYYYSGTTHPCEANGLGHYQQTNDVVYRQSTDYGKTWGPRVNITNYGTYGFEDGKTEPANSDLTCMVSPDSVLHIVWGSANRDPENKCSMYYAMKMWHWDSDNNCISLAYDASRPSLFAGTLSAWDHVVTQQNISWCDDRLYISFVRFGAHPIDSVTPEGDTVWISREFGHGPDGADTLYMVGDIMVVASDATGGTGKSWTAPVNLTDTDGTDCMPGSCDHEVYPFMAPISTDSLMIEYIEDKDAGAWLVGEGSQTDNPVMFMTWSCFTMADVGTNCSYALNPDPPEWDEIALAPNGSTAGCTTPASYSDSVILSNGGNVDIVYSAASDATWLTITSGAAGTASAVRSRSDTATVRWARVTRARSRRRHLRASARYAIACNGAAACAARSKCRPIASIESKTTGHLTAWM